MAHSLSARKRNRQSVRRRERNRAQRTQARSAVRRARELIVKGQEEEAQAAVREANAVLDRAGRKGTIHPNNAARRKSRLGRRLNAALAGKPVSEPPKKRSTRKSGSRSKKS